MLLRVWAIGLLGLLTLQCSSDDTEQGVPTTVQGCKDYFSASKGYGYRSDPSIVDSMRTSTGGGSSATNPESRTLTHLEHAIAECEAGGETERANVGIAGAAGGESTSLEPGTNCNYALLLTRDASVCIARARGFAEELGYSAGIVYWASYRRIVWIVRNTTERTSSGATGLSMTLDASTGEVLETGSWQDPS